MHLVYPLKFCISIVFNFSWDDCNTGEKLEAMGILWALWKGPVHTNPFSKVCIFLVIKNRSINSRSHYRSAAFLTVHTKTFQKDRIAPCDVSWTLCACYKHAPAIFSVIFFILMRFRPSTPLWYGCVFVSIHFQERFQIYAFSMTTLSVWTECLNASKYMSCHTEGH